MGETPLHLACRSCQADIVGQLVDFVKSKQGDEVANSYVNSVNEDGASALHYAANIKQTEVNVSKPNDTKVIKLLFEGGADINLRTKLVMFNLTCLLHLNIKFCSYATIKLNKVSLVLLIHLKIDLF